MNQLVERVGGKDAEWLPNKDKYGRWLGSRRKEIDGGIHKLDRLTNDAIKTRKRTTLAVDRIFHDIFEENKVDEPVWKCDEAENRFVKSVSEDSAAADRAIEFFGTLPAKLRQGIAKYTDKISDLENEVVKLERERDCIAFGVAQSVHNVHETLGMDVSYWVPPRKDDHALLFNSWLQARHVEICNKWERETKSNEKAVAPLLEALANLVSNISQLLSPVSPVKTSRRTRKLTVATCGQISRASIAQLKDSFDDIKSTNAAQLQMFVDTMLGMTDFVCCSTGVPNWIVGSLKKEIWESKDNVAIWRKLFENRFNDEYPKAQLATKATDEKHLHYNYGKLIWRMACKDLERMQQTQLLLDQVDWPKPHLFRESFSSYEVNQGNADRSTVYLDSLGSQVDETFGKRAYCAMQLKDKLGEFHVEGNVLENVELLIAMAKDAVGTGSETIPQRRATSSRFAKAWLFVKARG